MRPLCTGSSIGRRSPGCGSTRTATAGSAAVVSRRAGDRGDARTFLDEELAFGGDELARWVGPLQKGAALYLADCVDARGALPLP